jgi:hypothetical protein
MKTTVRQLAIALGINPDSYKDFESLKFALPLTEDAQYDVIDTWASLDSEVQPEHLAMFGVQSQGQNQNQVAGGAVATLEDAAVSIIDVGTTGLKQSEEARRALMIARAKRQAQNDATLEELAYFQTEMETSKKIRSLVGFFKEDSASSVEQQTVDAVVNILEVIQQDYSQTLQSIKDTTAKTNAETRYAEQAINKILNLKNDFLARREH